LLTLVAAAALAWCPLMLHAAQKAVGEMLRLKVKHGADAPHEVALIAVSKPPGQ